MRNSIADVFSLLRPTQWLKNAFVLTGLIYAHELKNTVLIQSVFLATLVFCLISSAIYICNDMIDKERDRIHPIKKNRPLAANKVDIQLALFMAILFFLLDFILSILISIPLMLIVLIYCIINIAYSFWFKHVMILDVLFIATGFMLRILAGTVGVGIAPSSWLIICGLLLTLFLGFAKRRAEIAFLTEAQLWHRKVLRFYNPQFLNLIIIFLGIASIVTYSAYTLYQDNGHHHLFYTIPFVIFGMGRYLYLLFSKQYHIVGMDIAKDIIQDRKLLITLLLWLSITISVLYG